MKLILTAPVPKLGEPGDIVVVKDGYGRNYLLPHRLAIRWTRGAETQIGQIKRARDAKEIKTREQAEEVRGQLEDFKVQIPVQAGDTGRLFGAVTPADIVLAVKRAGGPALDKRSIEIDKPIKTIGTHSVGVKLHEAVKGHVAVETVAK
ncbi:50S ribosomal protein L9 [Acidipropionibacterium jensenii]|uniref:50S ribosomal protein L9 n=1 Tax=Acidipropionibacterium jensenii TaxID=1749 RepID=UPI002649879A|nr:50S ribosomal protein L9 [Acidipropionibacterium jensenii]MDN5996477.1 50S ribosomal protein L9 [Acidipropionibacterium jensenii]MDN6020888.1 50S ribosomal protein L9 [Acidipropionibacterium jensenii]MDN6427655.1 50S ribosomal protein L9 [Acidipropionibacterium jensenii]MDN6481025.1 50S ribosomal protein L9 [Acidipropionibacterium jensenii]MDN6624403.1 50S ribosomal protein L9 [Acidipropionibacterium jensenii]